MVSEILVIDDEPACIELVKGLLPKSIKIKAALSGEIALKQLQRKLPDMVLLDVMMPGMDGFETLQSIKSLGDIDALPVVMVSGSNSEQDKLKSQRLGAIEFLTKPVAQSQLLACIDRVGKGSQV